MNPSFDESAEPEPPHCCSSCGRPSEVYGDMWETKSDGRTSWQCRVDEAGCRAVRAAAQQRKLDRAAAERLALFGPPPVTDEEFFQRFQIRVADLKLCAVQYRDANERYEHPPSGRTFKRSGYMRPAPWTETTTTTTTTTTTAARV